VPLDHAHQEFETALLTAAKILPDQVSPTPSQAKNIIATWLARGQAVFRPSCDHAQALGKHADSEGNAAAYISALRLCGDLDSAATVAQHTYQEIGQQATDPDLLGHIALALIKTNPETALQAAQTAIELSVWGNLPTRPIFYGLQAFVAHHTQNPRLRVQALQAGLELWPEETNWLVSAAETLAEHRTDLDSGAQASEYLERTVQLEPNHAPHYLRLSDLHQRNGDRNAAIRVLEQATGQLPEDPGLWLALAGVHQAAGDIPQIIRCASRATQLDRSNTAAQLILAQTALEVENPQKTLQYTEAALNYAPQNAQAHLLRAKAYASLDQPANALESLEQAIPDMDHAIPLELERVHLICQTQGPESAYAAIQSLATQWPEDSAVLTTLARIMAERGESPTAIQVAQKALGLSRDQMENKLQADNLHLLGGLLRETGQLDAAINYLTQAIELRPDNPGPYIELGRCYYEQRQQPRALEVLQQAINMAPDDPQPLYYAGLALKESQDFSQAEYMFKRATKLAPKNLVIRRQLGTMTVFNLVHNREDQPHFSAPIESKI